MYKAQAEAEKIKVQKLFFFSHDKVNYLTIPGKISSLSHWKFV